MVRVARAMLLCAALLVSVTCTAAQEGAVSPPPRTEDVFAAEMSPPCLTSDHAACSPFEDCNGRLLVGDAFLDPPCAAPPGWFASLQVSIVKPCLSQRMSELVALPGLPAQRVELSAACLDWTGAPQLETGYRFAQGFGEFLAAYRFLSTEGSCMVPAFDAAGSGQRRSRLNFNVVDIDYGTREFSLGENWEMRWRVGARIITNYFDTRAQGAVLEERASSHFVGAGPHTALELQRLVKDRNVALLGRLDLGINTGRIHQAFEETQVLGAGLIGGAISERGSQYVPTLRVQTGLSWSPPLQGRPLRLSTGYEFEEWWWVGRFPGPSGLAVPPTNTSNVNMYLNGVFIRAEWNY